jgi:ATP-binding cassette subfamily B protein
MAASINYMGRSLFPLLMLGAMIGPIAAADASAGRVLEVLDGEPEVANRTQAERLPQVQGRVTFEKVRFRYNGQEQAPVLRDVDLVAEPGETVAILGATGSGKSTLVNLIPRFYDVSEGRVTLDGVDVRDIPLEQLRAQMGVALQEAVLFTGTIRDNIRYGRSEASEEQMMAAARAAQAHDFITALPQGYDTVVGQRGVNLSGGQKQRISIARALLVQPKVLILDDSTSAVDVETEARIQAELETLMAQRTSFVIAQRISTVLNADKIVVLDRGRMSAVGTHEELLADSSIYREIYESQLGNGGNSHG